MVNQLWRFQIVALAGVMVKKIKVAKVDDGSQRKISRVTRKAVLEFPTRSDTNQAVQPQKKF